MLATSASAPCRVLRLRASIPSIIAGGAPSRILSVTMKPGAIALARTLSLENGTLVMKGAWG